MTPPQFGFIVEYVKDIQAARRWYEENLGLKVERSAPNFVQFDTFALASDEAMDKSGRPELYWLVDNAEAAQRELSQKAAITMPLREMPFGKVFAVADPEGRPRFLLELAQHRPSRPE